MRIGSTLPTSDASKTSCGAVTQALGAGKVNVLADGACGQRATSGSRSSWSRLLSPRSDNIEALAFLSGSK